MNIEQNLREAEAKMDSVADTVAEKTNTSRKTVYIVIGVLALVVVGLLIIL